MAIRHVREEEIIAAAVRGVQRVGREASRPTGTERARTMETAEAAGEDAAAAAAAAATAKTLASGAVTFSTVAPTVGDATGKPLGALWTVLVANQIDQYWELTAIGWLQRPLSTTVIPQINIGTGTFGVLNGTRLAADAIDGKTVTGALLRTAATGQRMEFNINGLSAINDSNVMTASLSASSGGLALTGDLTSTSGGNRGAFGALGVSSFYNERHTSAVGAGPNGGFVTSKYNSSIRPGEDSFSAGLNAYSDETGMYLQRTIADGGGLRWLEARVNATAGSRIWANSDLELMANGGKLKMMSPLEFQGDTDWANISFASGWGNNGGIVSKWRIKHGQLQISGRIARSAGGAIGGSYATFSTANSTLASVAAALPNPIAITPGTDIAQQGLLQINANGSLACAGGGVVFQPIATFLI